MFLVIGGLILSRYVCSDRQVWSLVLQQYWSSRKGRGGRYGPSSLLLNPVQKTYRYCFYILLLTLQAGGWPLGCPGDVRYSLVGVLRCCTEVCIVRYRAYLIAYWCIASGHEGSQSGLEVSLRVIVSHFVSYLDRRALDLTSLRPG